MSPQSKLFDLAIEFTNTGLFDWDIAHDVLLWNRAHAVMFGFDPDRELIAYADYLKRVHPADVDRLLGKVYSLLETPEPFTLEYRIVKPDGSVHWLHGRGGFLLDPYGKPLRMSGTTVDVTERKTIEAALTESEQKYRSLLETTGTAFHILSYEGFILDANEEYARLTGRPLRDVIGHHFMEWTAPWDQETNLKAFKACLAAGYVRDHEVDYVNAEGKTTPVRINASVIETNEGARLLTLCWDISERRKSEEALRDSENRFQTLCDSVPVGIFEGDKDGNSIYTNSVWGALSGLDGETSKGDGWIQAIHPEDREFVARGWEEARKSLRSWTGEYRLITVRGEVRWVRGSAIIRLDQRGNVSGYVGTVEDVTEHRLAEIQMREALEEKEILLREIHHRVKNNLQVIGSLLSFASVSAKAPEIKESLRDCQNRVHSIAMIHEQLYSDSNLGKLDLAKHIKRLVNHLLQLNGKLSERLSIKVEADSVLVDLDTATPCALLANELISNALRHAFPEQRRGRVIVSLKAKEGDWFELVVKDDGVGLPLDRYRELTSDDDLASGATIGLRLANLLSRQLYGKLKLEGGQGTTWRALLSGAPRGSHAARK